MGADSVVKRGGFLTNEMMVWRCSAVVFKIVPLSDVCSVENVPTAFWGLLSWRRPRASCTKMPPIWKRPYVRQNSRHTPKCLTLCVKERHVGQSKQFSVSFPWKN